MTKKTKLQKSRDITAAAKAIPGLTCHLVMLGSGKPLFSKADITTAGIPRTIETIDHVLGIQRQILTSAINLRKSWRIIRRRQGSFHKTSPMAPSNVSY